MRGEPLASAVKPNACGTCRNADCYGRLDDGQLFPFGESNQFAVGLVQPRERFPNDSAGSLTRSVFGRSRREEGSALRICSAERRTAMSERDAARNAEQPCSM
ncbi:MAG TPA: hypothetical protein VHO29_11360 [Marmoricola sp.]|nr:hypothetical protein [Marmoricola sp.]